MAYKKTLLIDFDGVIHGYNGTFSSDLGPPLPNARHACLILAKTFRLVCFSTRPAEQIEPYLKKYAFPEMPVTNEKLPAFAIVDDRAVCFTGKWTQEMIEKIKNFTPYWKTEESISLEGEPSTESGLQE